MRCRSVPLTCILNPQENGLQDARARGRRVCKPQTQADKRIGAALWPSDSKLMAGLDISEKRLPQDGRFSVRIEATYHRRALEHLAHRLWRVRGDAPAARPGFARMRQARQHRHARRHAQALSRGAGPHCRHGAGRPAPQAPDRRPRCTLRWPRSTPPSSKSSPVEDPVEYRLPGPEPRCRSNDKIDLTFAKVLRSVPAPGPGRDSGGRNARRRNRRDRLARRHHRTPGAVHACTRAMR